MYSYRNSKVWMTINSSFRLVPESLLTLRHGTEHMERVYKAGPLHAQTASALHLKALLVFYADVLQLL